MKNFDRIPLVLTGGRDLGNVIGHSETTVDYKAKAVQVVQGHMV